MHDITIKEQIREEQMFPTSKESRVILGGLSSADSKGLSSFFSKVTLHHHVIESEYKLKERLGSGDTYLQDNNKF